MGLKYQSSKFLEAERMKHKFHLPILLVYKKLSRKQEMNADQEAEDTLGESQANSQTSVGSAAAAPRAESPKEQMVTFKANGASNR